MGRSRQQVRGIKAWYLFSARIRHEAGRLPYVAHGFGLFAQSRSYCVTVSLCHQFRGAIGRGRPLPHEPTPLRYLSDSLPWTPWCASPLACPLKGIFVGPDCVKTHFIFEQWGQVVSKHVESRPVSYSPPEYGTRRGACPIWLAVSDFSHSLGRTVALFPHSDSLRSQYVLSGEPVRAGQWTPFTITLFHYALSGRG